MTSKQTLNTHDIYTLVNELKGWIGSRVSNIYDLDSCTICIKFNTINKTKTEKKYLLIESGTKFYWLDSFNATKDFPSSFSSKLRKHLNNKRLESVNQVNLDRVVDFKFGTGELGYHLIGEFYASGNIILTDSNYRILTLVHPHTYTDGIQVKTGNIYSFENSTQMVPIELDNLKIMFEQNLLNIEKKQKLKQFMTKLPIIKYSSNVLNHSLIIAGIDPEIKISSQTKFQDIFSNSDISNKFISTVRKLYLETNLKGYRSLDNSPYNNIYPYAYAQLNKGQLTEYPSFGDLISTYFQKLKPIETKEQIQTKIKQEKLSKQEKIIENIQNQIRGMEEKELKLSYQIGFLEQISEKLNIQLNQIKANGFDTIKLNETISLDELEFKIYSINYEKKEAGIEISNFKLNINWTESIWDNITKLYTGLKKIQDKKLNAQIILEKQQKINLKNNKINKGTENVIGISNENIQTNISVSQFKAKSHWFEQFNWFISSDGLIVISGKTADQNEQIVKKYMEPHDIYVHSEVFGSGSCVIKNKTGLKLDIPELFPKTIIEAGQFLIAHTKAWSTNTPDNAYWVRPQQVSKTPETGEYVSKGSFIIRGQKNLIIVDKLELGFGFVFKTKDKEYFIGSLSKEDIIEYAVPIVGTYSSLLNNKFKIKIIPGNQKIKKALSDVMGLFYRKAFVQEIESIKKISNDSIQKVMVTNVKFVMSK